MLPDQNAKRRKAIHTPLYALLLKDTGYQAARDRHNDKIMMVIFYLFVPLVCMFLRHGVTEQDASPYPPRFAIGILIAQKVQPSDEPSSK